MLIKNGVILVLYWGSIRVILGLYRGYNGIMEKKMEPTVLVTIATLDALPHSMICGKAAELIKRQYHFPLNLQSQSERCPASNKILVAAFSIILLGTCKY